ncbi:unnamed protein product [Amoebophrya sp. A120]|nr:unnamed protein product [Amoebophrya sp. A120]|eukprot:GSA120T00005162001.1
MPQTRDELLGNKAGPFARHNKDAFSPTKVRPKTASQPIRQMGESGICVYAGKAMSVLKAEAKLRQYSEPAKAFFVRLERVAQAELEKLFVLKMQHLFVRNPNQSSYSKEQDGYPGKPISFSDLLASSSADASNHPVDNAGRRIDPMSEVLGRSNAMYQGKQLTGYFQGVLAKLLLDFAQFSDALLNYTSAEERDFQFGASPNKQSTANLEGPTGTLTSEQLLGGSSSSSSASSSSASDRDSDANSTSENGEPKAEVDARFKKLFPEKAQVLVNRLEELSEQVTKLEQKNYLITDKFQHARRSFLREQILWQEKWQKVRNLIPDGALRAQFERLDSEVQIYDDEMYSDESKIHNMYRKQLAEMEEHYTDAIEKLRTKCAFLEDDLAAARNENEKLLFQMQQMSMRRQQSAANAEDDNNQFEGSMDPNKVDASTRMLKSDFLEFFDDVGVDPCPEVVEMYEQKILKEKGGGRSTTRKSTVRAGDGRGTDTSGVDDSDSDSASAEAGSRRGSFGKQATFSRKQSSLVESKVNSRQLRAMGSMSLQRQNTVAPSGLSRLSSVFGAVLEEAQPGSTLRVGATVTRGPDWDRSDEDIIPGNLGTVVNVSDMDGTVEVEWEPVPVDADDALSVEMLDERAAKDLLELLYAAGYHPSSRIAGMELLHPVGAVKKAKKQGCDMALLERFGLKYNAQTQNWLFHPYKLVFEPLSEERVLMTEGLGEMLEGEFGGNFLVLVRWLGEQPSQEMLSTYSLMQRTKDGENGWWFVRVQRGQRTLRSQKSTKIIMDPSLRKFEVTVLSADMGVQVEDDLPGFLSGANVANLDEDIPDVDAGSIERSLSPSSMGAAAGFASERRGTMRMSGAAPGGAENWTELETALDELAGQITEAEKRVGSSAASGDGAGQQQAGGRSLPLFATRWNNFVDTRDKTVTELAKILQEPAPKWVSFQDVKRDIPGVDGAAGADASPTGSSPRVPLSPGRAVPQRSSKRFQSPGHPDRGTEGVLVKSTEVSPAHSSASPRVRHQSPGGSRPSTAGGNLAAGHSRDSSPASPRNRLPQSTLVGKKSLLRIAKWASLINPDIGILETLLNQGVDLEEPLSKKRVRAAFRKSGLPLEKEELEELLLVLQIANRPKGDNKKEKEPVHELPTNIRLCDIFDSLHKCLFGAPRRRTLQSRPSSGSPRRTSGSPRPRSAASRVDLTMPDVAVTRERMRAATGEQFSMDPLHQGGQAGAGPRSHSPPSTRPMRSTEQYWSEKQQPVQLPKFQFAPTRFGVGGGAAGVESSSRADHFATTQQKMLEAKRKRSASPKVHANLLPEEYVQAQARLHEREGKHANSNQKFASPNREVLGVKQSVEGKRPLSSNSTMRGKNSNPGGPGTTTTGLAETYHAAPPGSAHGNRRPIFASKDYIPPVGQQMLKQASSPRTSQKGAPTTGGHVYHQRPGPGHVPTSLNPALTTAALRQDVTLGGVGLPPSVAVAKSAVTPEKRIGTGSSTAGSSSSQAHVQVPGRLFKSPSHVNMRPKSREALNHPKDNGAMARSNYMPDAWYDLKR